MVEHQLTALGRLLERAREDAGISKVTAVKRAGIGLSTWDTLTRGYIVQRGRIDKVKPKLKTVTAAARAVSANVDEAVKLAGYQLTEPPQIVHMDLSDVPTAELLTELQRRSAE